MIYDSPAVRTPRPVSAGVQPLTPSWHRHPGTMGSMRVLVVEDHEVLARAIGTGLRREGMAVDVVLDGDDALDHLAVTRYDVVVLDRDLPGTHGDEVCRQARRPGASESRVLMLTAASTVKERVRRPRPGRRRLPAQAVRFRRARGARPRSGPARRRAAAAGARMRRRQPRSEPPGRVPRRTAARPQPQGVRRPRVPAGLGRPGGLGRGTARAGLGRGGRPVHHRGQDDDPPAAGQARRAAPHPHRPRGRLPDRRQHDVPPRPARLRCSACPGVTLRVQLALLYGGLFFACGAAAAPGPDPHHPARRVPAGQPPGTRSPPASRPIPTCRSSGRRRRSP